MKMLAIGTGNNAREVAHFRKYFNVPFPILADPDFKAHEALKKARTPLILLVDKRSRPYKVIAVLDPRKGAEVLLQDIRSGVSLAAP